MGEMPQSQGLAWKMALGTHSGEARTPGLGPHTLPQTHTLHNQPHLPSYGLCHLLGLSLSKTAATSLPPVAPVPPHPHPALADSQRPPPLALITQS